MSDVTQDIGIKIITDAFGGATDSYIGSLMAGWNAGIMMLGAIIVGYIIIAGTLRTAHEGEILGRNWNSVWLPIRAALSIALIAPLVNGYSGIQEAILWGARQATNVANVTMEAGLNYLKDMQGGFVTPAPPFQDKKLLSAMNELYKSVVCMEEVNKQATEWNAAHPDAPMKMVEPIIETVTGFGTKLYANNGEDRIVFGYQGSKNESEKTVCGGITWATGDGYAFYEVFDSGAWTSNEIDKEKDISNEYNTRRRNTILKAINDMRAKAQKFVNDGTDPFSGPDSTYIADSFVNDYTTMLNIISSRNVHYQEHAINKTVEDLKKDGWASLGLYFVRMAEANNRILNMATDAEFKFLKFSLSGLSPEIQNDVMEKVNAGDKHVVGMLDRYAPKDLNGKHRFSAADKSWHNDTDYIPNVMGSGLIGPISHLGENLQSGLIRMLEPDDDVAKAHPIAKLQEAGHTILDIMWAAVAAYAIVNTIGEITPTGKTAKTVISGVFSAAKKGFGGAFNAMAAIFTALAMGLISFAIWAAYVVPMIPFMYWVFGIFSWLVAVFTALVASPIWVVSHAVPDGHDVFGQGTRGYVLLLGVLIRPALMVLGLGAALILASAIEPFISLGFRHAFHISQANYATGVIGILVGAGMYFAIMITTLMSSLKLINSVADSVLSWVGGRVEEAAGVDRMRHADKTRVQMITSHVQGAVGNTLALGGAFGRDAAIRARMRGRV